MTVTLCLAGISIQSLCGAKNEQIYTVDSCIGSGGVTHCDQLITEINRLTQLGQEQKLETQKYKNKFKGTSYPYCCYYNSILV